MANQAITRAVRPRLFQHEYWSWQKVRYSQSQQLSKYFYNLWYSRLSNPKTKKQNNALKKRFKIKSTQDEVIKN